MNGKKTHYVLCVVLISRQEGQPSTLLCSNYIIVFNIVVISSTSIILASHLRDEKDKTLNPPLGMR